MYSINPIFMTNSADISCGLRYADMMAKHTKVYSKARRGVCWRRWTHQSPRQGIRFRHSRGKFMRLMPVGRACSSGLDHMSQLGSAAWSPACSMACSQSDSASPTRHGPCARLSKLSKQTNRNNTLNSKQAQPSTRTGTCSQHGRKEWAEKMRHDEM